MEVFVPRRAPDARPSRLGRLLGSALSGAMVGALLAALALFAGVASAQETKVVVVVNAANAATSMHKDEIARLYLKKTRLWPSGTVVEPVDQREEAPVRRTFARDIVGKSRAALQGYWQQQLFTGKGVPPVVKGSDAEVLAFVAANPGAIGYVSAGTTLPGGVKVLQVQ